MKRILDVWRDGYDAFELTGSLYRDEGEIRFRYDEDYRGEPISVLLPIQDEPFDARATEVFFSALNPEGPVRENLIKIMRMSGDEYEPLLARLNDETIGALVFATPGSEPGQNASYLPADDSFLDLLASRPGEAAVHAMTGARLSLSGAMAKAGLYRNDETGELFMPLGAAPSNRIIKAGGNLFPHEVVNEALCLDVARRLGYPTAEAEVLRSSDGTPLLSVRRYDRPQAANSRFIDGQPAPIRLHQEDFCQVCGLKPMRKYEPTEGGYLRRIVAAASRFCDNSFGESQLLLEYTLFDYLIGNCDNHLKNYSLLYGSDWRSKEIAPLYDVVCTTIYPGLLTEMGVSLSESRSIFGLSRDVMEATISSAGLPAKLGMRAFDELAAKLPGAVEEARDHLLGLGFEEAAPVAELVLDGALKRAAFDYSPSNAKTLAR